MFILRPGIEEVEFIATSEGEVRYETCTVPVGKDIPSLVTIILCLRQCVQDEETAQLRKFLRKVWVRLSGKRTALALFVRMRMKMYNY